MMEVTERRIPSSDGVHQLFCRVYTPDGEVKGLFHVVHGMTEHIRRYDGFMREMAANGFVCYGFDNLGHGYTAGCDEDLGYLGKWEYMTDDVRSVTSLMKKEYGSALPCYLLGHSMGSFIVRLAATPKLWNKVIVMGTGGPNPASKVGLALIRSSIKRKGERAYVPGIEKLVLGGYANRFKSENDRIAWLSTKKEVRDNYRADKYCMFHFTLNGFETLICLQSLCNSKTWFKSVSADLPLLLVSGADDPVGSFGKGVTAVYKKLKANGKNVQMKLYPGCRHEILNDTCREQVIRDILDFIG